MSQNDPFGPEQYDAYQEPEHGVPAADRKGPGCLFWGCLISGILFLVMMILIAALVYWGRGVAIDWMRDYTDPQPVELPEVQIAEEERSEVIDRWEDFKAALDEGRAVEIALDSDAFNVVAEEEFPEAADHVYFTIEGDQLRGQISVPVEEFGRQILRTDQLDGRYFNASGSFDVFLRNGLLVLQLQEAEVKGEPVPEEVMQQIRTQNLAENMADDPEKRALLSRFERIEIKDGQIVFRSKGTGEPTDIDTDTDTEEEGEVDGDAAATIDEEPDAEPGPDEVLPADPDVQDQPEPVVEPELDPAGTA